jgi:hypothetical protein
MASGSSRLAYPWKGMTSNHNIMHKRNFDNQQDTFPTGRPRICDKKAWSVPKWHNRGRQTDTEDGLQWIGMKNALP